MSHPLLDGLLALESVEPLTEATLEPVLSADPDRVTAVFFTGDPDRKLETADVAVVLRELLAAHPDRLRAALVDRADEAALMKTLGVFALPALAFFHGRTHLETIPKIQDWSVYAETVPALLARALGAPAASR